MYGDGEAIPATVHHSVQKASGACFLPRGGPQDTAVLSYQPQHVTESALLAVDPYHIGTPTSAGCFASDAFNLDRTRKFIGVYMGYRANPAFQPHQVPRLVLGNPRFRPLDLRLQPPPPQAFEGSASEELEFRGIGNSALAGEGHHIDRIRTLRI